MHTDELIAAVRASGQLPSADPTFNDARVLQELTDMQLQLFERLLVNTREGHLLQQKIQATVAGTSIYRLPHRAITQGAESVELAASGRYRQLTKVGARDASAWEGTTGEPGAFAVRGDSVQLFPTPDSVYSLRVHYYLRPSRLVPQQLADPSTERGRILAIDLVARTLTVNAVPFDQTIEPPEAIETGHQLIDVIRPDGGHSLVLVDAPQSVDDSDTFTLPVGTDISQVRVGDYVRAAQQSDWPQLPPEFHRTLADATAAAICLAKGMTAKAQSIAGKVSADVERYTDLLTPRVKDQPKIIKPRYGVVRRSGSRRGF